MGNDAGDHVVQKRPVVAHEEDGARVVLQQLFQQFQRVDVQIVGRFVQHQHVGRAGKEAGQQQAVALAAREAAHGAACTGRAEQKVGEVALDVFALAVDLDPLAAGADEVLQRGVQVDGIAHLVEVGHLHIAALAHLAAVGGQLAQDHFEQGGLACAVGAHQADFVAAQQGAGEVLHDGAQAAVGTGVGLAGVLQLGYQLAAALASVQLELDAALHIAAVGVLLAQLGQAGDAGSGACAARFHALANPHFFLRQQLVGAGVDDGLLRELLGLLRHVGGKVARVAQELAAVQLDDVGAHRVQKRAVVADGDDAPGKAHQQVLQPGDGVQVEVVGRFVQQQDVRPGHQRLGQRDALFHAARQAAHAGGAVQVQTLQGLGDALLPVPAVHGFDFGLQSIQVALTCQILVN